MDKLLLVDGSNLLFQMFFGMPARIVNQRGKAIHGTMGFTGALLKIIRMIKPSHVAVLFDGEHENERALLNSDYKANRVDYSAVSEEENPFSQLSDIYLALDRLGIKHSETLDCEVDDWIASYAHTYGKGLQIVISSFDSDYFQLLTDNVSVLRYRGAKSALVTPEYMGEHFGVRPEQYADFKTLVGDTADNIRGAEHIGPKTAASLLREFGSLENVIENADRIVRPSIRQSVITNAERLRTNYRLIKLIGGAKLPFSLSQLKYGGATLTTREVLREIGLFP